MCAMKSQLHKNEHKRKKSRKSWKKNVKLNAKINEKFINLIFCFYFFWVLIIALQPLNERYMEQKLNKM